MLASVGTIHSKIACHNLHVFMCVKRRKTLFDFGATGCQVANLLMGGGMLSERETFLPTCSMLVALRSG